MKKIVLIAASILLLSFSLELNWTKVTDSEANISFNMPEGYQSSKHQFKFNNTNYTEYSDRLDSMSFKVVINFKEQNWDNDSLKNSVARLERFAKLLDRENSIEINETSISKFGDEEVPTLFFLQKNEKKEHGYYARKVYAFKNFTVTQFFFGDYGIKYKAIKKDFFESVTMDK